MATATKQGMTLATVLGASLLLTAGSTQAEHPQRYYRSADLVSSINTTYRTDLSIPVSIRDINRGNRAAGSHKIHIYLRQGSNTFRLRYGVIDAYPLRANSNRLYQRTVIAPRNLRSGRYQLCSYTDSARYVRESNENNNTSCKTIRLINRSYASYPPHLNHWPDLVSSISAPAQAGYRIPVTIRDYNRGRRATRSHYINVYLRKNGRSISLGGGNFLATPLRAGEGRDYRRTLTTPRIRTGSYQLCTTTDAGNHVRERNEANNSSCRTIYISGHRHTRPAPGWSRNPSPDLVSNINAPSYSNRSIPVTIYNINRGNRSADRHGLTVFLRKNGQNIRLNGGFIRAAAVQAGGRHTYRRTVTAPRIVPGRYQLCVTTDSGNRIREQAEHNNTSCRVISITGRYSAR